MNDLETELRSLLHDRAERVTPDPRSREAIERKLETGVPADVLVLDPRRRRPWGTAAAAAAAIAVVAGVVSLVDPGDTATVDIAPAAIPAAADVDPATLPGAGEPIFGIGAGYADPNVAATDYLRSRTVGPELTMSEAVVDADLATVDYESYQSDPGGGSDRLVLGRGRVFLWDIGDEWVVQLAVADGVAVDVASLTSADPGRDLLVVSGEVGPDASRSIRVLNPSGGSLLDGQDRLPIRTPPGPFEVTTEVEASSGYTQVVVEVIGGSVFAVTELTLEQPPLPLQRFEADSDPVASATEFATSQGWSVTAAGEPIGDPDSTGGEVPLETDSGTVHVRYRIDHEDRLVITDAWNLALDDPEFTVRDGFVTGRWQAPEDGKVRTVVTPFFGSFPDVEPDASGVIAGEVQFGPVDHPGDGFGPVFVQIELTGTDGTAYRAVITV